MSKIKFDYKLLTYLSGSMGSIGGIALGIRTLRSHQRVSDDRWIKSSLDDSDYFFAGKRTLWGFVTSSLLPPLAIVYTYGLILEEIERKNERV